MGSGTQGAYFTLCPTLYHVCLAEARDPRDVDPYTLGPMQMTQLSPLGSILAYPGYSEQGPGKS